MTHIYLEAHDILMIHSVCVPDCDATEPSNCDTDLSLGCNICSKPDSMCFNTGISNH